MEKDDFWGEKKIIQIGQNLLAPLKIFCVNYQFSKCGGTRVIHI